MASKLPAMKQTADWAALGVASNPSLRRLFAFKFLAGLVYLGSLGFPWFREEEFMHLAEEAEVRTGWGATLGVALAFLAASVLISAFRIANLPRKGQRRWVAASGFLAALVAVGLTAVPNPLSTYFDYRLGFWSALLLAVAVLGISWVEIRVPAFVAKARPDPKDSSWSEGVDDGAAREVVLLIHGTGSADEADVGEKWWQVGSPFWEALSRQLPESIRCQRAGEVFHWSGANSERHRRLAGKRLLAHLERLEGMGLRYHLVAHSHGGSVAWNALCRAVSRRSLPHLGRVVTLGTPFLHLRLERGWVYQLLSLGLTLGAAAWCRRPLGEWWRFRTETAGSVHTLILGLAAALLLALLATQLYRVGVLIWRALANALEFRRKQSAFQRFASQLRCLWSSNDETLTGLSASTALQGGILVGHEEDDLERQGALPWIPLRVMYQEVLGPVLDRWMWRRLLRQVQGIDLSGLELESVTPGPLADRCQPELESRLRQALTRRADEGAGRAITKIRQTLGVSLAQGATIAHLGRSLGAQLQGDELVHWGLYQLAEVRDAVCTFLVAAPPEATWQTLRNTAGTDCPAADRLRIRAYKAGLILLAALYLLVCVLISNAHRKAVYPLTDRFQAAAAVQLAAPKQALESSHPLEAVTAWAREIHRAGLRTTFFQKATLLRDRDWSIQLLLIQALVEQGLRREAIAAARAIDTPYEWACANLYLLATNPTDVPAAEHLPGEGLDAARIQRQERALASGLHDSASTLLRMCVFQRPKIPLGDAARIGEAHFLAEALSGDPTIRRQLLELWKEHKPVGRYSLLSMSPYEFQRYKPPADAWDRREHLAPLVLLGLYLAWESPAARSEARDLTLELLRDGRWATVAGLSEVLCVRRDLPEELREPLEHHEPIAWRLRRCGVLERADEGLDRRASDLWSDAQTRDLPTKNPTVEELDALLDEGDRLLEGHPQRVEYAEKVLRWLDRSASEDPFYRSVVRSRIGTWFAQASAFHLAMDAARGCATEGDRLAVYAAVLKRYSDEIESTGQVLEAHFASITSESAWDPKNE